MAAPVWNGKGKAPSKAAALAWVKAQGVKDPYNTWTNPGETETSQDWSALARENVGNYYQNHPEKTPPKTAGVPAKTVKTATTKPAKTAKSSASDPFGAPPTAGAGNRGSPLFPFTGTDATLAGIQVADAHTGKPIAPRYYEADALAPASADWSPEKRAALQQQMMNIGLYGAKKTTLGTWGPQDQQAYTALLEQANVSGRTALQQAQEWLVRPPSADQLGAMSGQKTPAPLTVQLSNPADIRAAAATADLNTMGGGNTDFVQGAPAAYQAQQTQAQTAAYNVGTNPAGGTAVDAPSAAAFLAEEARKDHPIEVGGYSFLKAFNQFTNFITSSPAGQGPSG